MLKTAIIPAETQSVHNSKRPKALRFDLFKTILMTDYTVSTIRGFFNSCGEVTVALDLKDSMTRNKVFFSKIGRR